MSTYIKLNKQDTYVTTYTAHKPWVLTNHLTSSYGIRKYTALSSSGIISMDDITLTEDSQSAELLYRSIHHLYYSGFFTGSAISSSAENYHQTTLYDSASREIFSTASLYSIPTDIYGHGLVPGTIHIKSEPTGSFYIVDDGEGKLRSSGSFNYSAVTSSQTTTHTSSSRFDSTPSAIELDITPGIAIGPSSDWNLINITWKGAPSDSPITENGSKVSTVTDQASLDVISFTSATTLETSDLNVIRFLSTTDTVSVLSFTFESSSFTTIKPSSTVVDNQVVGDVIYTHGNLILTEDDTIYHVENQPSYSLAFKGSYLVYTHNFRCRTSETQLNYSQNPSITSGSLGDIKDFATGSYFRPYVTTVGLYNDSDELIAIGKMGQPIPKSKYMDMTFVVKFDI